MTGNVSFIGRKDPKFIDLYSDTTNSTTTLYLQMAVAQKLKSTSYTIVGIVSS